MATWPGWKYSLREICLECRQVQPFFSNHYYCPKCFKDGLKKKPVILDLRWISDSVWYNPLTWGAGHWEGLDSSYYFD